VWLQQEKKTMFTYAMDDSRGLAVCLFSGSVGDEDRWACARAFAEFRVRFAATDHPALILVNDSREKAPAGQPSADQPDPLHDAEGTPLLAVVLPPVLGILNAVPWTFHARYMLRCVGTFQEAMDWIEERRGAALFPFFELLLKEARSAAGTVTLP
jgi:hypothetical protein